MLIHMLMYKFIFAFSLLLFQFPQTSDTRHLGKWESDDGTGVGYLILDEEDYATLKADGQVMGGKSSIMRGVEVYMLYEIDYQTTPVEIDFVVYQLKDDTEMARLKGILEFIDENNMKLALGFSGIRPENLEGDETIIFKKQP